MPDTIPSLHPTVTMVGPATAPRWTVVVAAAGKGSRLGSSQPKILFPVAGKSILVRLIEAFDSVSGRFVFVLAPSGVETVQPALNESLGVNFEIAIQAVPIGMADAVNCGLGSVQTPFVAVVWGDQAALSADVIRECARIMEDSPTLAAALPTLYRPKPYIHFERDADQRIAHIRQAREGDVMPDVGESDAGVFFFRTKELQAVLPTVLTNEAYRGRVTSEVNFLPILVELERRGGVRCVAGMSEQQAAGINSPEDVQRMEHFLAKTIIP